MADEYGSNLVVPFSRRIGSPSAWIDGNLPVSARIAIEYVLDDLVSKRFVESWIVLAREFGRIARQPLVSFDPTDEDEHVMARAACLETLKSLRWDLVLDFCERLFSHLACAVVDWKEFSPDVVVERDAVQAYIGQEINRVFLEEHLAFAFRAGTVCRRAGAIAAQQIERATGTFGDGRLRQAREHFRKAQVLFGQPAAPDYENAVKEAVCAVESAAKSLFPAEQASTLGKMLPNITGESTGKIPFGISDTFKGVYAFRNCGPGVSHGRSESGAVTRGLAEFVLGLAAAQIVLLHEIATEGKAEVPF